MFLRIIIVVCFFPLYSFAMNDSGLSPQESDQEWFLKKFIEYRKTHEQRQNRDIVIARFQKKSYNNDSPITRRAGIVRSNCLRAKL